MKFIPWTLFGIGLIIMAGELIRVQYFTGNIIGEYTLYERQAGPVVATFTVTEHDLPVRANFTLRGRKESGMKSSTDGADFVVNILPDTGVTERRLRYRLDQDDENSGSVNHKSSMLLKSRAVGDWSMSLDLESQRKFTTDTITATIRTGSEAANKLILTLGAIPTALGFIWGLMISGRRY